MADVRGSDTSARAETCRQLSRTNEALWRTAWSRGCLSKALNDKDIIYSHVKALAGWQLGRSNIFQDLGPESDPQGPSLSSAQLYSWEEALHASNWEEAETEFQPVLQCPVILEDLSRPPQAVEDATPALLTLLELLDYLSSPDWSNSVRLRVIDGELLRILNYSLLSLEKRRMVRLHSLHALANNRVKATAQQQVTEVKIDETVFEKKADSEKVPQGAEEVPKKEKGKSKTKRNKRDEDEDAEKKAPVVEPEVQPGGAATSRSEVNFAESAETKLLEFPTSYQTDEKFVYELLSIELVYFEKQLKSNIPFIVEDLISYDYPDDLPVSRHLPNDIKREPYSHAQYRIDKVRYPAHENFDLINYIAHLEQEIVDLKENQVRLAEEAKAQALMDKSKIAPKEKVKDQEDAETKKLNQEEQARIQALGNLIPDIEYIAEDPYLRAEKCDETPIILSKKMSGQQVLGKRGSVVLQGSRRVTVKGDASQRRRSSLIGSDKSSAVSAANTSKEGGSEENLSPSLMRVPSSASSSLSSLISLWESDTDHNHLMQRLSLTNHELYISSLYEGREENRWTAGEKLEERKRRRAKERTVIAEQTLQAAVERAKGDLYTTFKHLARKKEAERRRSSDPKVKHCKRNETQLTTSMKNSHPSDVSQLGEMKPLLKLRQKDTYLPIKEKCGAPPEQCQLPQKQLSYALQKPLPAITSSHKDNEHSKNLKASGSCLVEVNNEKLQVWESYRRSQDHCELESALNNKLERGVLQRMPSRDFFPNYKKAGNVKGKSEKNRSQNKTEMENKPTGKSYDSYNLFLSAYNRTFKISELQLKNNIIQESFCVDKHGVPQEKTRRPSVRRIDFSSPEQLIKYLVNVRCSLLNNSLSISWHPFRSQAGSSKDSKVKKATFQTVWDHQKQSSLSQNTSNNGSKIKSQNQRQARLFHCSGAPVEARETVKKGKSFGRSKPGVLDRNRSAVSNTALGREERTTPVGSQNIEETNSEERVEPDGVELEGDDYKQSLSSMMTESEILKQELQSYQGMCSCEECEGQLELLADLKPKDTFLSDILGCPPILGRLRRDFHFLENNNESVKGRLDATGRVELPHRPKVLSVVEVGERLLKLMEHVMIRKEILCSSRGFTYTTVTFTKLC